MIYVYGICTISYLHISRISMLLEIWDLIILEIKKFCKYGKQSISHCQLPFTVFYVISLFYTFILYNNPQVPLIYNTTIFLGLK